MKKLLFVLVLLLMLPTVVALKSWETTTINIEDKEYAITFAGVDVGGGIGIYITKFTQTEPLKLYHTIKKQTPKCIYLTAKQELGLQNLIITACETPFQSNAEGTTMLIYPYLGSDFCISVDLYDADTDPQLNNVFVPEQCLAPTICGDNILGWDEDCDDGNTNEGDGCNSLCTIEAALKEEEKAIELNGECYKLITTQTAFGVTVDINSAENSYCNFDPGPDPDPNPNPAPVNNNVGGGGGGGGGGSKKSSDEVVIVDAVTETEQQATSEVLFNDNYCNNQLKQQPCVDNKRIYSCESYTISGEFKEYKEYCVSEDKTNTQMLAQQQNLQKTIAGQEKVPVIEETKTFFSVEKVLPLGFIVFILAIIVSVMLLMHFNSRFKQKAVGYEKEVMQVFKPNVPKTKSSSPGINQKIPASKIKIAKQFIQTELNNGFEKQEIINALANAGWDKQVVEKLIAEFQNPNSKYEEQLKAYVFARLQKGISKDTIKKTLLGLGWKKELIEKVMQEF